MMMMVIVLMMMKGRRDQSSVKFFVGIYVCSVNRTKVMDEQ